MGRNFERLIEEKSSDDAKQWNSLTANSACSSYRATVDSKTTQRRRIENGVDNPILQKKNFSQKTLTRIYGLNRLKSAIRVEGSSCRRIMTPHYQSRDFREVTECSLNVYHHQQTTLWEKKSTSNWRGN